MSYLPDTDGMGLPSLDRSTTWITGSAFTVASAVLYGNAQLSAYGYDLSKFLNSSLASFGGVEIAWASAISLLAILGAYIGNNANLTEFSNHQTYLGGFTALSVLITTLSSDVTNAIAGGTSGIIFTAILLIGYISMVEVPALKGEMR